MRKRWSLVYGREGRTRGGWSTYKGKDQIIVDASGLLRKGYTVRIFETTDVKEIKWDLYEKGEEN